MKNLRDESIEDDPLYDKVPSDEDYASVASEPTSLATNNQLSLSIPISKLVNASVVNLNTPTTSSGVNNSNSTSTSTLNNNNNNSTNNLSNDYVSPNNRINRIQSQKSQLNPKVISKDHKIVELKTNFEKINTLDSPTSSLTNSTNKLNQDEKLVKLGDNEKKALLDLKNENEMMKSLVSFYMYSFFFNI